MAAPALGLQRPLKADMALLKASFLIGRPDIAWLLLMRRLVKRLSEKVTTARELTGETWP